jgi:hypothetical protein
MSAAASSPAAVEPAELEPLPPMPGALSILLTDVLTHCCQFLEAYELARLRAVHRALLALLRRRAAWAGLAAAFCRSEHLLTPMVPRVLPVRLDLRQLWESIELISVFSPVEPTPDNVNGFGPTRILNQAEFDAQKQRNADPETRNKTLLRSLQPLPCIDLMLHKGQTQYPELDHQAGEQVHVFPVIPISLLVSMLQGVQHLGLHWHSPDPAADLAHIGTLPRLHTLEIECPEIKDKHIASLGSKLGAHLRVLRLAHGIFQEYSRIAGRDSFWTGLALVAPQLECLIIEFTLASIRDAHLEQLMQLCGSHVHTLELHCGSSFTQVTATGALRFYTWLLSPECAVRHLRASVHPLQEPTTEELAAEAARAAQFAAAIAGAPGDEAGDANEGADAVDAKMAVGEEEEEKDKDWGRRRMSKLPADVMATLARLIATKLEHFSSKALADEDSIEQLLSVALDLVPEGQLLRCSSFDLSCGTPFPLELMERLAPSVRRFHCAWNSVDSDEDEELLLQGIAMLGGYAESKRRQLEYLGIQYWHQRSSHEIYQRVLPVGHFPAVRSLHLSERASLAVVEHVSQACPALRVLRMENGPVYFPEETNAEAEAMLLRLEKALPPRVEAIQERGFPWEGCFRAAERINALRGYHAVTLVDKKKDV